MLSFRMILFCAGFAICLWGLFYLLENLKQPELLRSTRTVIVKGCAPAESEEAAALCPQLHCQKALLDSNVVPLRARFTVIIDKIEAATSDHLIAGTVTGIEGDPAFACRLQALKVVVAQRISEAQLAQFATQDGGWKF